MSGCWLDKLAIRFSIFLILTNDLKLDINLGIPCLIFLSVHPLPPINLIF